MILFKHFRIKLTKPNSRLEVLSVILNLSVNPKYFLTNQSSFMHLIKCTQLHLSISYIRLAHTESKEAVTYHE